MNAVPFEPYIVACVFALTVGATLGGALIAVLTSRLVRAVSGLMICCLGLAGLYYFLNSPFLALMEILIYVGAVCVTIIFAVMLAEPDEPKRAPGFRGWAASAVTVGVSAVIGISLAQISLQGPWPTLPATPVSDGSIAAIGRALLTTYSLAFELISLLLLLAVLGALVIARTGRTPAKPSVPLPSEPARPPTPAPEEMLVGK
jgi:NADH-quinone oxidoreductase subunit J